MKIRTNFFLIILVLLTCWIGLCNARAFYDPGTQRWLNRDPLGDIGSLVYRASPWDESDDGNELSDGAFFDIWTDINRNLYGAMGNNPLSFFDSFGLQCDSVSKAAQNPHTAADVAKEYLKEVAEQRAQQKAQQEALKQAVEKAAKEQAAKKAAQKASEKMAKKMAQKIGKDLGPKARREFHDMKDLADRAPEQLKQDALELYQKYGKSCPSWMSP